MSVLLPQKGKVDPPPTFDRTASIVDDRTPYPAKETVAPSTRPATWRFVLAFAVAIMADAVFAVITPFEGLEIICDVAVAGILWGILGFNWILIPTLMAEAVPGLDVFPFWTLAVLALAVKHK